jgi:hypothetical protein
MMRKIKKKKRGITLKTHDDHDKLDVVQPAMKPKGGVVV